VAGGGVQAVSQVAERASKRSVDCQPACARWWDLRLLACLPRPHAQEEREGAKKANEVK